MSAYITLEAAKEHLRVDFNDDDVYIQSLCDLVEELVAVEIGQDLSELEVGGEGEEAGTIPLGLRQSMLLMIGHFYMSRESVIIGVSVNKIPYGYEFLVSPYKNYTIS